METCFVRYKGLSPRSASLYTRVMLPIAHSLLCCRNSQNMNMSVMGQSLKCDLSGKRGRFRKETFRLVSVFCSYSRLVSRNLWYSRTLSDPIKKEPRNSQAGDFSVFSWLLCLPISKCCLCLMSFNLTNDHSSQKKLLLLLLLVILYKKKITIHYRHLQFIKIKSNYWLVKLILQ